MLVLSRRLQEKIVMSVPPNEGPTEIVIQLVDIRGGDKARIGISAPIEVEINRLEIQHAIEAERRITAAGGTVEPRRLGR